MDAQPAESMPPRATAGHAPLRVPGSVRRTSSIDVSWPNGQGGTTQVVGRARDIVTPAAGGAPVLCAEDSFDASLRMDRTLEAITTTPLRPAIVHLVGQRGGGGLRQVLADLFPAERRTAAPLYLLLDDLAGVSLVAPWAWSQWKPDWLDAARAAMPKADADKAFRNLEGVCIGFAPGSSAFNFDQDRSGAPAPDLRHPDDPQGWHEFTVQDSVGMRRARRIDVWLDEVIIIDSAFQDSATTPAGGRAVVHEYDLRVTADPQSLRLLSLQATPRVLPHGECTAAPLNLKRLVDTPLAELRERVLTELRGTAGCTHLNDALRALAEVPVLVSYLRNNISA